MQSRRLGAGCRVCLCAVSAKGGGPRGGIYAWPGKRHGRYGQATDIWGRCVHVEHLEREVGARRTQVRQLSLLGGARLAN